MKMKTNFFTIITFLCFIYGCTSSEKTSDPSANTEKSLNNSKEISSNNLGARWPFKVEKGVVHCIQYEVQGISPNDIQGVIFEANGKTYAINGVAESRSNEFGYSNIEEIWLFDDKHTQELIDMGVSQEEAEKVKVRISIAPIIEEGLKLCN